MADQDIANGAQPQVQIRVMAQYIKDLSFENPNIERMLAGTGENPNIEVQINVNGRQMRPEFYESSIELTATAKNNTGTLYELELVYAGLFQVQNIPQDALEPFLLVNCPTLLFPYMRRLISDTTREGGFPPLLLDPIDFAVLYVNRKRDAQAASNDNPTA
jgi:preprotein translocase subunit SecB